MFFTPNARTRVSNFRIAGTRIGRAVLPNKKRRGSHVHKPGSVYAGTYLHSHGTCLLKDQHSVIVASSPLYVHSRGNDMEDYVGTMNTAAPIIKFVQYSLHSILWRYMMTPRDTQTKIDTIIVLRALKKNFIDGLGSTVTSARNLQSQTAKVGCFSKRDTEVTAIMKDAQGKNLYQL
ncbi:hypothetical protein BCR43DRAFT_508197 [Syncephalastrum racemosum]|uniref:Uncharacterized protein n=1 Tax=Syncephalastrum racemosum TaxID=13706 RepID=A0A1X2H2N1_SYNRA|nr:hypothetical protein BCR43DRAFT_508197 [Syncephalastrum racemosum]